MKARQIAEFRQLKLRERELSTTARLTLDQLHQKVKEGSIKELPIVLKADVQGSVEVLTDTLTKLSTDKVKVRIIHAGAGAITETDVNPRLASNAVIVGSTFVRSAWQELRRRRASTSASTPLSTT
jgi:translation initiation factor IF-2